MSRLIRFGRCGQVYVGWATGNEGVKKAGEWSVAVGRLLVIASPAEREAAWEIV